MVPQTPAELRTGPRTRLTEEAPRFCVAGAWFQLQRGSSVAVNSHISPAELGRGVVRGGRRGEGGHKPEDCLASAA